MTVHTPTQHSNLVGGSSAARVIACPASVRLSQTMPPSSESPYAAEGTALHNAIEHLIYEGKHSSDPTLVEYLTGKEFYGVVLTTAQAEVVITALKMFDAYWEKLEEEDGKVLSYAVEVQVKFPDIPDAFGTADILLVTPLRSVVWDWKFGGGVVVSAKGNKQMGFYGRGAAHSAKEFFWPDPDSVEDEAAEALWDRRVDLVIAQPRIDDQPNIWTTDVAWLLDLQDDLVAAVDQIDLDPAPVKRGDHCRWCTATPICPAYKAAAGKLAQLANGGSGPVTVPEEQITEADKVLATAPARAKAVPTTITPDQMAEWLVMADIIDEWSKSVRGIVMDQASNGVCPTGMKLVRKLGNTSYVQSDFTKVDRMLGNKGLTAAERRKVTNITPTQANKLLKAKGKPELSKAQADRFESGTALVPLDDPRPPIQTIADHAAEATEKLKALQQG